MMGAINYDWVLKPKIVELRQNERLEVFDSYLRNNCIGSVEIKLLRLSIMPP